MSKTETVEAVELEETRMTLESYEEGLLFSRGKTYTSEESRETLCRLASGIELWSNEHGYMLETDLDWTDPEDRAEFELYDNDAVIAEGRISYSRNGGTERVSNSPGGSNRKDQFNLKLEHSGLTETEINRLENWMNDLL